MCIKICSSIMSLIVSVIFILWLIRALEGATVTPLTSSHSFQKVGHLADDISFARLSATVDLSLMLRSVTKAESTLRQLQPKSHSPFAAAFQLEGSEALQPAAARLKTLHSILFAGPVRHRRGLAGLAAMGMASYAIYNVESLRGYVNNVIRQQHAIHAALETATTQLTALQRSTAGPSTTSSATSRSCTASWPSKLWR